MTNEKRRRVDLASGWLVTLSHPAAKAAGVDFQRWGRGYATEGARAAIAFGFATAGLAEIVAMTAVANERSRRVMAHVGMTRNVTDDFDHPNIVAGHPLRRHVLYRLTAGDWAVSLTVTGALR